jgi:hypothetical protein
MMMWLMVEAAGESSALGENGGELDVFLRPVNELRAYESLSDDQRSIERQHDSCCMNGKSC